MPDGVVQWFDRATGEGRIVHGGRRYVVFADDIASKARAPGARVHFDVARGPADRAVDVSLRSGTRVHWRQRRFGSLSGARGADEAGGPPSMTKQTSLGRDLERHPMRLAELWTSLLAAGDLENLIRLYAPDAALRAGGDVLIGPTRIRRFWAASPLLGADRAVAAGGGDDTVELRWAGDAARGGPASVLWIVHGEITEQWLGTVVELFAAPEREGETDLVLSSSGDVADREWDYAIDKLGALVEGLDRPVLFASVRLERSADPARERGAMARVTVDIDGEPVRAHVAAAEMPEAIDLLAQRLRDRLRHLSEHRRALRRRGSTSMPGVWRHGDLVSPRLPSFPRPVADREVVRHKAFTTDESTVDEAVFDMESMDYDFFLFTDLASGQDAIVWRDPEGYRLRLLDGVDGTDVQADAAGVELEPGAAPTLSLEAAQDHLDVGALPWVFFKDAATERGRVLYRRYDGHYGLITPAREAG